MILVWKSVLYYRDREYLRSFQISRIFRKKIVLHRILDNESKLNIYRVDLCEIRRFLKLKKQSYIIEICAEIKWHFNITSLKKIWNFNRLSGWCVGHINIFIYRVEEKIGDRKIFLQRKGQNAYDIQFFLDDVLSVEFLYFFFQFKWDLLYIFAIIDRVWDCEWADSEYSVRNILLLFL